MKSTMLVPIDTSDLKKSVQILPFASNLAMRMDMMMYLHTVLNPNKMPLPEDLVSEYKGLYGKGENASLPGTVNFGMTGGVQYPSWTQPKQMDEIYRRLEREYEEIEGDAIKQMEGTAHGLIPSQVERDYFATTASNVSAEILRVAKDKQCDLIAVTAHDRNILAQAIGGSVTKHLIRDAHVPILAITPHGIDKAESGIITGVIVPLDGTKYAEAVLPYVEKIATRLSVTLILVHAIKEAHQPAANHIRNDKHAQKTDMSSNRPEATGYLSHLVEQLEARGVKAKWELIGGDASEAIAGVARSNPNALLALATHGRTGIHRWLSGSISEDLIRNSKAPVLVIPPSLVEKPS